MTNDSLDPLLNDPTATAGTTRPADSSQQPANILVTGLLSAALSACGGGGGGGGGDTSKTTPPPVAISNTEAARFLLQAQLSTSDSDINAVISQGYSAWLDAQMAQSEGETGTDWLNSRGINVPLSTGNYFSGAAGDYMIWHQLMTNSQQVRQRLALALSEMMVVSLNGLNGYWPPYQIAGYWDLLTAHVFGNFRNLLEALTLNPAMGSYLNTKGNKKENTKTGRLPDENYAREVMQLFTIGLHQLNNDGTIKKDSQGQPLETYTATDVSNLARVFTGYDWDFSKVTYATVAWTTSQIPSTEFTRSPMALTASNHSTLAATFLGVTIPASADAANGLKMALDTLFNHPNVGPFFARQMIQRLVTSNPSAAYINRVASVFNDNGSGTRGDLKSVWRAILTDTEARTATSSSSFGKIREPMLRFVQWARTFNASSATGDWKIGDVSSDTNLSQSPLRASSVFNFFRPGYIPPQTAIAAQGIVAPEFQIHNESSTAAYINFMTNVISNGYQDVKPNYTSLQAMASDPAALIDWLNLYLAANQLTSKSIDIIRSVLNATPLTATATDTAKQNLIKAAILMVMCSPEYLIQK